MATKSLRIDIIENKLIVETQLEETIQLKTLIARLKVEKYLNPNNLYFVKTAKGITINNNSQVKTCPDSIVITENEKWNQTFSESFDQDEITKISNGVALQDNTFWFFPFLNKFSWDNPDVRCHLFEINGIRLMNGDYLTTYISVQYSVIDKVIFNYQNLYDYLLAIKQIMAKTLHIEFTVNSLTADSFFKELNSVALKMQDYVAAHSEINWNAKIDSISILGFKHINGSTQ